MVPFAWSAFIVSSLLLARRADGLERLRGLSVSAPYRRRSVGCNEIARRRGIRTLGSDASSEVGLARFIDQPRRFSLR
jgi:hypothetical protein